MPFPAGTYAIQPGYMPAIATFAPTRAGAAGFGGESASRGLRAVSVAPTVRATLSREEASFSASARWSGIVAVAAVLAGVWALDRYVLDVPFVDAKAS